jgi:hypothetical protein|tara:strand:+ start:600 stop:1043 length:444 start_codon:yes stop_codon:yes gene_type:complete
MERKETYDEYRHDVKTPISPMVATFNSITVPAGVELQELVLAPFQDFSYLADLNMVIIINGQIAYSGEIPTKGLRIDFMDDNSIDFAREIVIAVAPSQEFQEHLNSGLTFGNTERSFNIIVIGRWSKPIVSMDKIRRFDIAFITDNS